MKIYVFFTLLLVSFFPSDAGTLTNSLSVPSNILAIYLVRDNVPRASITDGTITPTGLSLIAQPILSDADFVSWNLTNHNFVINPTAAKRVAGRCMYREFPFVLMSNDEPIYLGMFETSVSSRSAAVPVILTDFIVMDCFMGTTNVPVDVWRMIGRADPGITERLMAMTKATTNVTLQIDRGYPSLDGFGRGVDRRGDKRIAAAVEKLFGKSKH